MGYFNTENEKIFAKNLGTLKQWLSLRGTKPERWKERMNLITEDFLFIDEERDPDGTLLGIPRSFFTQYVGMDAETGPGTRWGYFEPQIYANIDNPNFFTVQCLYKEESAKESGLFTFYFEMREGKIRAVQQFGSPHHPGEVFSAANRYRAFTEEEREAFFRRGETDPEDALLK